MTDRPAAAVAAAVVAAAAAAAVAGCQVLETAALEAEHLGLAVPTVLLLGPLGTSCFWSR